MAAVNELCGQLDREGELRGVPGQSIPRIPPHYDARTARILLLLSNPGPKAGGDKGSGFLSYENDDGSAARTCDIYREVGLADADAIPWNAYPWYVHTTYPNGLPADLIDNGLDALSRLLDTVGSISAVIAHGGDAQRAMRKFADGAESGTLLRERGIRVWDAWHTSNRAFIATPEERARRFARMCDDYRDAMRWVGLVPCEAAGMRTGMRTGMR